MSVATSASTPAAGSASTPSTGPRGPKQGRGRVVPAKNKALEEKRYEDALDSSDVDLDLNANRVAHHTDQYDMKDLILRRGLHFTIIVTFHRNINKEQDDIVIQFTTGARPQENKGTLIRVYVNFEKENANDGWTVKTLKVSENYIKLEIKTEADSHIGKYDIFVETKLKTGKEFNRRDTKSHFYLLFNAWNEDDEVFMKDDDERNEYVMNETGKIWFSSTWSSRRWHYGQFEDPVVEVALRLLNKGYLRDTAMNSALSISRCIAALVNSNDDGGVLVGSWSGNYAGGKNPSSWTGSVPILKQYNKTGLPVKYGQCWVFSALSTSLLRALGIPTRSVTNRESAHDTDGSMTIDKIVDWTGKVIDGDDSVWNFHVWNESWFKRNDLPAEEYDGWQAHDATPQEKSKGVFCCGPASVRAIKMGHVNLNYDAGFIFAEVNGDKITWRVNEDGSMEISDVNSNAVGLNISTKAVGENSRHDLTLKYKFQDGTKEANIAKERVYKRSSRMKSLLKDIKPPLVTLKLIVPEGLRIGNDIGIEVSVTNITDTTVNAQLCVSLANVTYTGMVGTWISGETKEIEVKAGETNAVTMNSHPDEYERKMTPEARFKCEAICNVFQTRHAYTGMEMFELVKPDLTIKAPKRLPLRRYAPLTLETTNTTTLKLHNGFFSIEGSHCDNISDNYVGKVILPGETVSVEASIRCNRPGKCDINATFTSDEFEGQTGDVKLDCL